MSDSDTIPVTPGGTLKWTVVVLAVVLLIICLSVGSCAGIKAFSRAQKRADAGNAVSITDIQIRNQTAYARVIAAHNATVTAQAQQRYLEAVGIRRAQDEISKTLTPLYLQHEAIQALQAMATSGQNNTVVYIPSGANGVPLISTTPPVNLPAHK